MIAILAAILIGLPRVLGVKTALYQAVAHLYVGVMIGAYAAGRMRPYLNPDDDLMVQAIVEACEANRKWPYLIAAVGLTVLETVCFLVSRS